jgi:hypothetical protein
MFEPFPKIGRLSKPAIVTEKIDGTNGQIHIVTGEDFNDLPALASVQEPDGRWTNMYAGSRNRYLDTSSSGDNFGFAKWVQEHAEELFKLGEGRHYGEWWGPGIGPRGYPVSDRRFSLFNSARWGSHNPNTPACCLVVPVIGSYSLDKVDDAMIKLKEEGSLVCPGFMNPEGIIISHDRVLYKKTFEHDTGKWGAAA